MDSDDAVVTHEDGSVTYTLAEPCGDLAQVTLRRIKASDLEAADRLSGLNAHSCFLIARLAGLDAETVNRLDGYDYTALKEVIQNFFDAAPDRARTLGEPVTEADGGVTVRLAFPRPSEGMTLDEITLRRVRPADLQACDAIKGDGAARSIVLLARLANVPQATIRSLDGWDFARLNVVAQGFLSRRRATGARQS
jgi:hypothetical protein